MDSSCGLGFAMETPKGAIVERILQQLTTIHQDFHDLGATSSRKERPGTLDESQAAGGEDQHLQEQPAVIPPADVGFAIRAVSVS